VICNSAPLFANAPMPLEVRCAAPLSMFKAGALHTMSTKDARELAGAVHRRDQ